ncbi:MAG: hypothetical protein ABIJ21_00140 [Nanoarchaeota archaeon]
MQKRGGKPGQAWSLDLIIAVVIFVVVMTLFYTLLVREPKADITLLKREGKYISDRLPVGSGGGNCSFIDGRYVDIDQIQKCYLSDADQFKQENNIKSRFCIYMTDQNGRVITIDNRTGFGFNDLNISGVPCGEQAIGVD